MNIASSIERGGILFPRRPALFYNGTALSYREVDEQASRTANALRGLGVGPGDRVALVLPNSPTWVTFYLGVLKLGAVVVSVNPSFTAGELRAVLADSGARVALVAALVPEHHRADLQTEAPPALEHLLTEEDLPGLLEPAAPVAATAEVGTDTPAVIVYTSGTTGMPKGAVLSHGNVRFNMEAKQRYLGIRPDDRLILFLPLFHCFGQNAILNAGLGAGASIVLHPRFSPEPVAASLREDRVTMLFGVPTTYILLAERLTPEDLATVRYVFSAAAILPREIEERWRERFGHAIHQGYGLTETSPFASYNHRERHRPGSIGTPIDGVEMKIVDVEDGRTLPPGRLGEIAVRGPNVMLGYWSRPEETAAAIRDGWFHTGDIGRQDEDGYFYIEDRLKDMVNVGGLKVYPAEVENALYRHPAVAEAAVYAAPDPVLGERVAAAVVLRPGLEVGADDLLAVCREHLAKYKVPDEIHFVEQLPKSPTGKILKRVLRDRARAEAARAHAPAVPAGGGLGGPGDLEEWIRDWMAGALGVEPAALDARRTFFESGLTSTQALGLVRELSEHVGRPVPPTSLWSFPTIETLAGHLAAPEASPAPPPAAAATAAEPDPGDLSSDELARRLAEELAWVRSRTEP